MRARKHRKAGNFGHTQILLKYIMGLCHQFSFKVTNEHECQCCYLLNGHNSSFVDFVLSR